jgi:hypothetical protein
MGMLHDCQEIPITKPLMITTLIAKCQLCGPGEPAVPAAAKGSYLRGKRVLIHPLSEIVGDDAGRFSCRFNC